jgi:hypothetical protein
VTRLIAIAAPVAFVTCVYFIIQSCERKVQSLQAKAPSEVCSQYSDEDKRQWCLGNCAGVTKQHFRALCEKSSQIKVE